MSHQRRYVYGWVILCTWWCGVGYGAGEAKLTLKVVDSETKQPIAVRMHLLDQRGKPVLPPGFVSWKDHFVFDGQTTLKLKPGAYSFEMERGPEYRVRFGHFTVERNAEDTHQVAMERFVDMAAEGWWSGDLHIHRKPADIELLLRAEDLHIGPVITWWNKNNAWDKERRPDSPLVRFDDNRFYHLMAGEDERGGGALLFFNLDKPLPIQGAQREYPASVKFAEEADAFDDVHIDAEKPFWWDFPLWVASGRIDSVGLANNHLWRSGGLFTEAWGKPRDKTFFPDPQGNGRWSQQIYYELLNCGLRVPPSAGSASGVLNNPVGYNRVYVHCGEELTWEKWWRGLQEGKVVVTNGPLIRPRVNGELPGHVFTGGEGETLELNLALNLAFREKVDYLEVVKDGKVVREVRLPELAEKQGQLPPISFDKSGWMLIRAVTNNDKTYRYGSTGPYYVQIGQQRRISRSSAQFFLDWVNERARQIKLEDPQQLAQVVRYHEQAREFWGDLVARANAE